ncbi:hypothetical protein BD779DRAFT_1676785 [Infundibulicybe gibba]|nr:hypothetical protein BD779DRAFT_1676785 [Infundibulicybe gibba]
MSRSTRPRRKNANTDPTKILREYNQKRRTHTQIALDNAQVATATAEKAEKSRLEHEKKVQEVSKFEDKLSQEDKISQKHAARPDLYSVYTSKPKKPANTTKANKPTMEMDPADLSVSTDEDGNFTDPPQDGTVSIPEESVIDTESSDGGLPGFGLDDGDVGDEDEDGVENLMVSTQLPVDDDYAEGAQSDGDSLDSLPARVQVIPVKAVRKVKAKRGALRGEIHQAREEPPRASVAPLKMSTHAAGSSSPQKRKQPEPVDVKPSTLMRPDPKRPKTSEPAGLLSNWKKLVPGDAIGRQLIGKTLKLEKETHDDTDEPIHGELYEDEPDETILAVRSTKGSAAAIKIHRARNSQVNVRVTRVEGEFNANAGNSSRHVGKKVKYTVSSLPFSGGTEGAAHFKKYCKTFKPTLIAWASMLDDPFGTNSLLEPTVRELWALIFPKFNYLDPMMVDGSQSILLLASEALTSWRSDLGKEALKIVKKFLLANVPKDDIPSFIEHMRNGPPKFTFIYGDPRQKAVFRNEFISPILAAHFKKTASAIKDYGYPAGTLGLCTASIERALEIWEHGEPPEPSELDEKNKAASGFTEAAWGFKACAWIATAKKLNDKKWGLIIADTHKILKAATLGEVIDVDDEDEEHDPRAQVDV